MAVYELEPDDPSDIAAYQSCYGTHAAISYVPVDAGAGTGPGSGEAALDIENLIGLAPNVNVLVYQGPNSNSGSPGSGPYDTFSAIINQNRARVVTVSWGQCEMMLGQSDASAENTLFQQATIQGQSILAASGDSGAEDCDTGGALSQTQAAVDDPSSQPFVTGVGGTTLSALGPRPTEAAWNSGGTVLSGMLQPGATGGGISALWPMPSPQLDSAATLNVRTAQAAGSACGHPGGFCREVPDVAADGDPATGYLIYWNGKGEVTGEPAGWQGIGGTSGASPLWAAMLALTDASRACSGAPVGYANPALYRAAGSAYGDDFNDVASGNNDFTGSNGGRYAAAPGYDPATGLGTPNAASLATALCANTIKITNPGPHQTTIHQSVSLSLHATSASGAPVTYAAAGLPPGLKLDASTGRVTGRPTRGGRYTVRVSARDSASQTAGASFVWTVSGLPTISRLSLRQGRRRPDAGLHRHRRQERGRPAHARRHRAPRADRLRRPRRLGHEHGAQARAPALHRPRVAGHGADDQAAQDGSERADHPCGPEPGRPGRAGRAGTEFRAAPPPGGDGERRGRDRAPDAVEREGRGHRQMTLLSGSSSAEIAAPIDRCWAVVQDVTDAPRWQNGLDSVEVIERDDVGRARVCDVVNDAKFTKVRVRVGVTYDPPRRLEFTRLESDDVDEMRASWELEELGPERTRATYSLAVDPGHVGMLARPLERALRPLVVGRRADELARAVAERAE